MKKKILIAITFLILMGCEKALEIYVGFPLQPENINSIYEPGLNIFGMLKTGNTFDESNQFFEVQHIYHVFDTNSLFSVDDAKIELTRHYDNGTSKTYKLQADGEGRYSSGLLQFFDGDVWSYRCVYDTIEITSETRIPNRAIIVENSLEVTKNHVSFTIQNDITAFMYDIYYVNGVDFVTRRIIPERGFNTQVSLDINFTENSSLNNLFVLAYDKNYQEYVSTSNIFFKPNAFRPRYSTVEGGYGCFCSMSSLMLNLELE